MKIKVLFLGVLLVFVQAAYSQEIKDSMLRFSLEEAKNYALVNSPVVKNSALDLETAKKKIFETTAIGLPQVTAKGSFSYMPTLSATVKTFSNIGDFFNPLWTSIGLLNNGQYPYITNYIDSLTKANANAKPVTLNDLKWNAALDITVSQIIFSGSYLVGLQTSKVYKSFSEFALSKSKDDLIEAVTSAYFLVLVAKENKSLLDSTYRNTSQTLNELKRMFAQGMIDETDVDQLQLTTNALKNSLDLLNRQTVIAERMLKFQLGMNLDNNILLTDSIKGLLNSDSGSNLLLQNFSVENNIDFKLMDTQSKLMKMNLNLNKSTFLPEISAFYQHDKPFNSHALNFNPPDLIGVNLTWQIFTSGQRYSRISEAKYTYQKALNSQRQASDGLRVNFEQSKSTYLSAMDRYNTTSENLKLAEKIYKRTLIKYKEGMISSTDLTQTQNQYLQSQSNYYNAVIDLTSAKAKLEKLLTVAQ